MPRYLKNIQHLNSLLYKQTKADPFIKSLYKALCVVYKKSISSFYLGKESADLSPLSKNTFFGFIDHKLKARYQLPPLFDNTNQVVMKSKNEA